jgi:hypothetical protein
MVLQASDKEIVNQSPASLLDSSSAWTSETHSPASQKIASGRTVKQWPAWSAAHEQKPLSDAATLRTPGRSLLPAT